jgi:phage repressor protein C with HTH and peptisase S24 domain
MGDRDRTPFGARLKWAREYAGLQQVEVVQRLADQGYTPVKQGTLSGLEREASASRHTATLAKLYGVNPHWLATGEGRHDDPVDISTERNGAATAAGYGAPSAGRKRLAVRAWVKAEAGGALLPQERLDLGYVEVYATGDEYALRVRGDGLSPMADDGQVLIVSRTLAPMANGRALLTLTDGARYCRRFLAQIEDSILTQDIVTGAPRTFDRAEVESLERVVNVCDQGGWISGVIPDAATPFDHRLSAAKDGARRRQ